jgi:hypothetical protein
LLRFLIALVIKVLISLLRKINNISHFSFILEQLLRVAIELAFASFLHLIRHHLHVSVSVTIVLVFGHSLLDLLQVDDGAKIELLNLLFYFVLETSELVASDVYLAIPSELEFLLASIHELLSLPNLQLTLRRCPGSLSYDCSSLSLLPPKELRSYS